MGGRSTLPKSLSISPPKQFTHGLCHWVVKTHNHSGRSRHVFLLRLTGVSSREWDTAESHRQASCQGCEWDHRQPHPSIQPNFFRISQATALGPASCQVLKIGKLKVNPPHKKVWEFSYYTTILNTFLLYNIITESRLGSQKNSLFLRRLLQISFF